MNSHDVVLFDTIVISVVGLFGGYAGYTVNGVPKCGSIETTPGVLGLVTWVWDSLVFMIDMATFCIDGMPEFMSIIFLAMTTSFLFAVVKLVRGSGG